jgi:hypothetical protein
MASEQKNESGKGKTSTKEIGEGDRESARRYNENAREFVENELDEASSEPAGRDVPTDELTDAEKKARARVKETDPEVSRNYDNPAGNGKH